MRKSISALLTALLLVGGLANLAFVDPGPNGNNEHGLCTAYYNGQKKGHDKNGNPGPFQALEDDAQEQNPQSGDNDGDEMDAVEAVFEFCQDYGIGGNPDHGRYTCEMTESDDPDNEGDMEAECTENDAPGNSGNSNGHGNGNGNG